MKIFVTYFILLVVLNNKIYSQEPTYASLPDSSNILVVYNSLSDSSLASRVYFYRLKAGDYIKTGKMLLLRWFKGARAPFWIR